MIDPKVRTKVIHSESSNAYNVVGTDLGKKYKIAQIPYVVTGDAKTDKRLVAEAFHHANFISECFNNSGLVIPFIR